MFIFRLEDNNKCGPFSKIGRSDTDVDIRQLMIGHCVPQEQGLPSDEMKRVNDDLIYGKEYHFAWSSAELMRKYIKPDCIYDVPLTGYMVSVYWVDNEHTYLFRDGQVIFDRQYERMIARVDYVDFSMEDFPQWEN